MSAAHQLKPLLRWAGSKKRQALQYRSFFPAQFKTYAEPFAGSASFCFSHNLRHSKLNDINRDLMNFYAKVTQHPGKFWADVNKIERNSAAYQRARSSYNRTLDDYEKAVLFYYLNRNCFNGIYRVNRIGEYNVPFSDKRVSPYLTEREFLDGVKLLQSACLSNLDFQAFCDERLEEGDFVFLDPPYAVGGSKRFHHYNKLTFTSEDFNRLTDTMVKLNDRGVSFMLSFPAGEYVSSLTKWNRTSIQIRRTIAGQAAFRGMSEEILVFNYDG